MPTWVCTKCPNGIPHTFKHGRNGYTRHSCRCDVCESDYRQFLGECRNRPRRCPTCAGGQQHSFKHGLWGYEHHGCRCEVCVAAHDLTRRVRGPRAMQHGYRGYTIHSCRCDVCRDAYVTTRRRNREYIRSRSEERNARARHRRAIRTDEEKARERKRQRESRRRTREYISARDARYVARLKQIPGPRNGTRWTPAEDSILNREDLTVVEQCFMLGRSYSAVLKRRQLLGNPEGASRWRSMERRTRALQKRRQEPREDMPWTAADDAIVARSDLTCTEQARMLGRSYRSTQARRIELTRALPAPRNGMPWTADEDAIIRRDDLTRHERAVMLGRSYWAVKQRRKTLTDPAWERRRRERESNRMGSLATPRSGMPWTADEDAIIRRDDLTRHERASMLGRSYWAVKQRRKLIRKQAA